MLINQKTMAEICRNHEDISSKNRTDVVRNFQSAEKFFTKEFACLTSTEELQIAGNNHVWSLLHIGQIHADKLDSPEAMNLIEKHQRDIYELLEKKQPKYLIIEWITDSWRKKFSERFDESELDFKDPRLQKEMLYIFGWAILYTFLHPEAHVLPGENTEQKERKRWIPSLNDEEKRKILLDRELFVAKQAYETLQKDPGASIIIVYGGLHDFSNSIHSTFSQDSLPNLRVLHFPKTLIDRVKMLPENH